MNLYLILQSRLQKENPNTTFVFRRHPIESEEYIKNKFINKPKNLKLIYKFSVTPWIYNCNFHLHSGCLSSLETIKLKKFSYLFTFLF